MPHLESGQISYTPQDMYEFEVLGFLMRPEESVQEANMTVAYLLGENLRLSEMRGRSDQVDPELVDRQARVIRLARNIFSVANHDAIKRSRAKQ